MRPLFSIIVLTYNEQKTIGKLLTKIHHLEGNYSKEILVIDSESRDKTPIIINQKQQKFKNIRFYKIKKNRFNFGKTRNYEVELAKGKFVCFISGDCEIESPNFLDYFLQDFSDEKVVAVFGKQIPKKDCSFFFKAEIECLFENIENYNKKGESYLIQNLKTKGIYKKNNELHLLYFLSNVFCCYRRSFLLQHKFEPTGSEDLIMCKKIINLGYNKIYDSRCVVIHSHNFNIYQYYKRQIEEYDIFLNQFHLPRKNRFFCKFRKIFIYNKNVFDIILYIFQVIIFYLIKILVYLRILLKKLAS